MLRKRGPKKGAPEVIREGNGVVKIHSTQNRGKPIFTIVYRSPEGGRVRRNFLDYNAAKLEAEKIAIEIHNGTLEKLILTGEERQGHERAVKIAAELDRPIDIVLLDAREAISNLPEGVSLTDAARFYARHCASTTAQRHLPEVVTEFLDQLATDGRSTRYQEDASARLKKLAASFEMPIGDVDQAKLQKWLNELKVAGRTRNNFRALLIRLFNFAQQSGYLPPALPTAAEGLSKAKDEGGEIGILLPKSMKKLLLHASERLVPYLAIGGFAGLRSAEILRLHWEDINFKQGHIEVKASKAKTSQRRLAPLTPNLKAWLRPYRGLTGPICPTREIETERRKLAAKLEIEWPNNALRHSFASYRLAHLKNAPQLALEMGNSPQVIFSNYREVVTPKSAERWFAISPKKKS